MDLRIDQPALGRALRLVTRVTPTRTTHPVLQAVRLDAGPGRLTLRATDLEVGAIVTLAADVSVPGSVAIPARLLADYVGQLPAEPVHFCLDPKGRRGQVCGGRFVANVATVDLDGFPLLPVPEEAGSLDLDAHRLRAAIERVAFAAARDDARPALAAVLVELRPDGLVLAATDGFRLGRVEVPEIGGEPRQFLLPARAAAEFARLLADAETARLAPAENGRGVFLVVKETTLFARLVEGQYPDLERVIPRDWRTRVTLDTTEFRQAVCIAGLFGSGDSRPIVLEASSGQLRVRATGDMSGDALVDLAAEVEGEAQAIGVNTRLFVDVVDAVHSARVSLAWTAPSTPLIVREADRPESADLWIAMPLHLPAATRAPVAA